MNARTYTLSSEGSLAAAVTGVTGQITIDGVIPGATPELFALLMQSWNMIFSAFCDLCVIYVMYVNIT